jgi:hypothetical protein
MIIEGALKTTERVPFSVEQATAMAIPNITERTSGIPSFRKRHIMVPLKPMIAPMDISKFPDMIRMATPEEIRPNTAIWDKTPLILFRERYFGLKAFATIERTIIIKIR